MYWKVSLPRVLLNLGGGTKSVQVLLVEQLWKSLTWMKSFAKYCGTALRTIFLYNTHLHLRGNLYCNFNHPSLSQWEGVKVRSHGEFQNNSNYHVWRSLFCRYEVSPLYHEQHLLLINFYLSNTFKDVDFPPQLQGWDWSLNAGTSLESCLKESNKKQDDAMKHSACSWL